MFEKTKFALQVHILLLLVRFLCFSATPTIIINIMLNISTVSVTVLLNFYC